MLINNLIRQLERNAGSKKTGFKYNLREDCFFIKNDDDIPMSIYQAVLIDRSATWPLEQVR